MSSVTSFLKCLTLMTLSLAMKDVRKASKVYLKWEAEAEPFLRQHKLLTGFKLVSKEFKANMEFAEDHGADMASYMKVVMPSFQADHQGITKPQLDYIKKVRTFFGKDSASAWNWLSTNVSSLGDHKLASLFLEDDVNDVADMSVVQGMKRIVQQLTGRKNDYYLSTTEVREFAETDEKVMAKYKELRDTFKDNYKAALLKFVRLTGKPNAKGVQLLDVEKAKSYLETMGCNYLPTGFVGKVDEKGRLYTSDGKLLMGRTDGHMEMNPNYDPKTDNTFYCKLLGDQRGELRTKEMNMGNKAAKFANVEDFSDAIDSHRARWLKDLDNKDIVIKMCATITEMVHLVYARIGSKNNKAEGKTTYGLTTLRAGHTRITTQGANISYPGKKGTPQKHEIKPDSVTSRKILKFLAQLNAGKKANDYVFTYPTNRTAAKLITSYDVNRYLKTIGITMITIHSFRHAAATKEAKEMLAHSPFNKKNVPTQAAAERWVKEEAKRIGEMLHHRSGSGEDLKTVSSMAFKAYINPIIVKDWFVSLGLRAPNWIPDFEED